jgi:tellurite resistance protein
MYTSLSATLAVCVFMAADSQAIAQTGSPGAEIKEMYARLDQTLAAKNTSSLLSIYAANFFEKNEDGTKTDFPTFAGNLRNVMTQTASIKSHTEVAQLVASSDGRLLVLTKATADLTLTLPPPAAAKFGAAKVPIVLKTAGYDIWEHTQHGWRIAESGTLMTDTKIDPAFQQQLTARTAGSSLSFSQTMQIARQMQCQTQMIHAMGWQRQGYLTVMPSCN